MLIPKDSLAETRAAFRWTIPARYNIGVDCCDRIAADRPDAVAIVDVSGRTPREVTFAQLRRMSNRLAGALQTRVARGERIGVLLPQSVETAVAHLAAFKMGAISIPLFKLFGPEALVHRLGDAGAKVVITDAEGAAKLADVRSDLPGLTVVMVGPQFDALLAEGPDDFAAVDTASDDPALLIYTSGTTGPPKGVLHAHRVLLGHLPGVEMSHDFLPQPGDRIWTPADWAWIGGLLDVLLPALHHAVPVVACRFRKFTARAAFDLMREHRVRNAFLPPTALKMMRALDDSPPLSLRSVASGGEPLGAGLLDWGRRTFGCEINEFYGQTECNMVVSACAALLPTQPGVMGAAVPGHDVAVIDAEGSVCATGLEGDIAVRSPDPVMFLRYWNRPDATAEKFRGDWLVTGDRGCVMPDGRLRFVGRDDDVISSGGYRIGPAEIEDCLIGHPAVRLAGVVGAPDPVRGQAITAFVQLADGYAGSPDLATELTEYVRTRLAAHEAPRVVRFVADLPLTTTGKIIRADLRRLCADGAHDPSI